MRKHKKGFTIVELVIVIGVIGILSAILIPTFVNVTENAKTAALKSDLANAYSMYVAEAADGEKDNSDPVVYYFDLIKQEEAVLEKGNAQYIYRDGWRPAETGDNIGTTYFVSYTLGQDKTTKTGKEAEFGGYVVKTTKNTTLQVNAN